MQLIRTQLVPFSVALLLAAAPAVAATSFGQPLSFVEPDGWSVGDLNSTFQMWDAKSSLAGNTPDAGHTVNPAGLTQSTHGAQSPAFLTGTSNLYSFSGNYEVRADIYNHGGSSGAGGYGLDAGTHVIVQLGATLSEGVHVLDGTLEIVDPDGGALTGGASGDILNSGVLFDSGGASGPFGPVSYRQTLYEFYLSDYTGDFRVQWTNAQHVSMDVVRVDSMIADSSFGPTAVPEPGTFALLAAGGIAAGVRARRSRRHG